MVNNSENLSSQIAAEPKHLRALNKINEIRNSIVGFQNINWSEHIYPLVAALDEAGIEGMGYPEAKEYFGTMLERTIKAEQETLDWKKSSERLAEKLGRAQGETDAFKQFVNAYDEWAVSDELLGGPLFDRMIAAREVLEKMKLA